MLNTIRISVIFLVLVLLVFLPKTSYAWGGQHGRDDGRAHDRHGVHSHANPDLTLVTGMDNIDSRVLIAADPDPAPEEMVQSAPEEAATIPSPMVSSDEDGNFIVNVPNNTGGHTPIRIQKSGNGYVGPQGEFYYPFPDISQLKAMYGV